MLIGGLAVGIWGAPRSDLEGAAVGEAKDVEDARRLLRRHARTLDRGYLEPLVRQSSEAFARTDILEIYNRELERSG